jgi:hypothetical protein
MQKKKRFPDYTTEIPVYPSISKLWNDLSIQDAGLQANQIAIEFLQEHIAMTNVDENIYVNALASKFKISSGSTNWSDNKKRIAESYIILTYNVIEVFAKSLRKEMMDYKSIDSTEWISTRKVGSNTLKIDPFNQVLENISEKDRMRIIEKPEYHLIEYYRLLRNDIVHSTDDSRIKSLECFNEKITHHIEYFGGYYKFIKDKIPAPNDPGSLTFRDFILYSRSFRYLSYLLNNYLNLRGEQIFRIHKNDAFFKHSVPMRYLDPKSSIEKREKRLRNQLKTYLRTNFCNSTEECIEEIRICLIKDRGK